MDFKFTGEMINCTFLAFSHLTAEKLTVHVIFKNIYIALSHFLLW